MRSADPDIAISAMLKEFAGNRWLTKIYWPENEQRVRLMISYIRAHYPPGRQIRILDVGCFNGYLSIVLHALGYDMTATDVCEIDERQLMFEKAGIDFFYSNLNDLDPFSGVKAPFDVVIMGEVIEHVLNHPPRTDALSRRSVAQPGAVGYDHAKPVYCYECGAPHG